MYKYSVIKDLNIRGFWYLQGVLERIPCKYWGMIVNILKITKYTKLCAELWGLMAIVYFAPWEMNCHSQDDFISKKRLCFIHTYVFICLWLYWYIRSVFSWIFFYLSLLKDFSYWNKRWEFWKSSFLPLPLLLHHVFQQNWNGNHPLFFLVCLKMASIMFTEYSSIFLSRETVVSLLGPSKIINYEI